MALISSKYIMNYSSQQIIKTYVILLTVTSGSCWQFFTSLVDYTLSNSRPEFQTVHSEYYYGNCGPKVIKKFYAHIHMDHLDVLGKIIIRGWLDVPRIPTCILLRATSYEYDMFRSTAFNFQMCVPRITYCHTHRRYKYFYYEWYLPKDMPGGMNWDIYFYGPVGLEWQ